MLVTLAKGHEKFETADGSTPRHRQVAVKRFYDLQIIITQTTAMIAHSHRDTPNQCACKITTARIKPQTLGRKVKGKKICRITEK